MKRTILQLVFTLLCVMGTYAQRASLIMVTDSMALRYAMEAVGDTATMYDYYIGSASLSGSTTKLLVLVDLMPDAGWNHPCKLVYINRTISSSLVSPVNAIFDATQPPLDVDFRILMKPNRMGEAAAAKPSVMSIPSNSIDNTAGHTYALIVSGGVSKVQNMERYWNDCSFIYQTLRRRYGIPRQNIKVAMADGTDPAEDMNLTDRNEFASSPLDLDNDNTDDIEYAATKGNIREILETYAQELTDSDHLLVFVTDHGGTENGKSYICLWGGERLYPEELSSYLDGCQAGFITFILGQCNSGGFIDGLKASNRVVSTACKADERSYSRTDIPYDEFLYRWTCTLNGQDAFGNSVTRNAGIINAHNYAASNDRYANGGSMLASETPAINYFTNSVVSGLALDSIPPTVYLCFYHDASDCILKTQEYTKQITPSIPVLDRRNMMFWKSKDIWVRNQNDGFENTENQTPIIEDDEARTFIYTRIKNIGVKPYINGNTTINLYWALSSLYLTEDQWRGYDKDNQGGKIIEKGVKGTIEAGGDTIILTKKTFDNASDYTSDDYLPICILARIDETNKDELITDSDKIVAAWESDQIAQNNTLSLLTTKDNNFNVILCNVDNITKFYKLQITTNNNHLLENNKAEISLKVSPPLEEAWKGSGEQGSYVEFDNENPGFIRIKNDSAIISDIALSARARGYISMKCSFIAEKPIEKDSTYDIDVVLIDNATGRWIGGETFRIHQSARPAISTDINSTLMNGHLTLSAENSSEQVSYKWYDSKGNLIGTGNSINVPASSSESEFTVRSESLEDGAVSYSKVNVSPVSAIKSLENTKSSVKVVLRDAATSTTVLKLSSASASLPTTEYEVEEGERECEIPTASLPSGVYGITLVEDGIPVESRKVLK